MNILVADKQYLVFEGIKNTLSKQKPNLTHTVRYQDIFPLVDSNRINLLIVDIDIFEDSEIAAFFVNKLKYPTLQVCVLTNNDNEVDVLECLESNVDGFLMKDCSRGEFVDAIEGVGQGKKIYCQPVLNILCNQYVTTKQKKTVEEVITLTPQEIKITEQTAWGLTAKEIADRLNISIHTVNTHRKNIFKKIGVKNSSELVMFAIKKGMIDATEYYI